MSFIRRWTVWAFRAQSERQVFTRFATRLQSFLNEQTGNLKLAQKFLGHADIGTTADIYTHTPNEAERGAAVAIERAIFGDLFPVVPETGNRNND